MIALTQDQRGTSVPIAQTEKVVVERSKDLIFVGLAGYWVEIDLANNTFSVGDYEG